MLGLLVANAADELAVAEQWATVHESRRDDPYPDVEQIEGTVRIVPGETLGLDIEMRLTSPGTRPLDALSFSFNPGMGVDEVRIDGEPMTFEHADGLLSIALPEPLAAGSSVVMSLRAEGIPNPYFGYLDSAINPARMESDSSALPALGWNTSVFERRYVRPDAIFRLAAPTGREL